LGWWNLKPGKQLIAVEKAQGLRKGEHVVQICPIEVLEASPEPLGDIIKRPQRHVPTRIWELYPSTGIDTNECDMEGFPEQTPEQFVDMFCKINKKDKYGKQVTPETVINRILFDYL
jgi:hypothetical protein